MKCNLNEKRMRISFILLLIAIIILSFFIINIDSVEAVGEISFCCEKTVDGAFCQNAPNEQCAEGFRKNPTSCESTAYCKPGTCINVQEGTCLPNTAQRVCEDKFGVWDERDVEDIPQCQRGCCLLGDQAVFDTQTRCKRLSSIYGLETNFRADIKSEEQCILSATSEAKGACVFDSDEGFSKTCGMLTQKECLDLKNTEQRENVEFHEGFLCSAEELATDCGPSQKTTCVEGEDEVFFLDTCGNVANIYDASKINDQNYWREIKDKSESCNSDLSNANSASCGSCDYFLGSTCKKFERGVDRVQPRFGDFICRDLSCEFEGQRYEHGETFCKTNSKTASLSDSPGARDFRMICQNGEVLVEPCAEFRQEVCLESSVNGFSNANCVQNLWQECVFQENQDDCENTDKRDCTWFSIQGEQRFGLGGLFDGPLLSIDEISQPKFVEGAKGYCVPKYPPGFEFDSEQAVDICSFASKECIVVFERGKITGLIGDDWDPVKNKECLNLQYFQELHNMCISLGDCGIKNNYQNFVGDNDEFDDLIIAEGESKKAIDKILSQLKRVFTR